MQILVYLKKELNFPLGEWKNLDKNTQDWYKVAAVEEMKIRGIEISQGS